MREGVDWALGLRSGVVVRAPARTERALMFWPGRLVGGTLTLNDDRLEWKKSRWAPAMALPFFGPILALTTNRGPTQLRMEVASVSVAPAGRMIPWLFLCLLWLTWWGIGLLISTPLGFATGWTRRCIAVHLRAGGETYCFAVRDVDGWLADIDAAGGRKAILVPWRMAEVVQEGDFSAVESLRMPEASQTTG
jgi:hypothetical protein